MKMGLHHFNWGVTRIEMLGCLSQPLTDECSPRCDYGETIIFGKRLECADTAAIVNEDLDGRCGAKNVDNDDASTGRGAQPRTSRSS